MVTSIYFTIVTMTTIGFGDYGMISKWYFVKLARSENFHLLKATGFTLLLHRNVLLWHLFCLLEIIYQRAHFSITWTSCRWRRSCWPNFPEINGPWTWLLSILSIYSNSVDVFWCCLAWWYIWSSGGGTGKVG